MSHLCVVCMCVCVPVGDQQTGTEPSSAPSDPRITPGGDTKGLEEKEKNK